MAKNIYHKLHGNLSRLFIYKALIKLKFNVVVQPLNPMQCDSGV